MKKTCMTVCLGLGLAFGAGAEPTSFPDGTSASPAAELNEFVKDKVFTTTRSDGVAGRFNYRSDGKFEIFYQRSGSTTKEFGGWRAEDGKLCVDDPVNGKACNEVRVQGANLYYKRNSNGEVLALTPAQ